MKIFTYIKHSSERVKNKSFRKLGSLELWKHLLYELKDYEVYVDTDSKIIRKECFDDINLRHVYGYPRKFQYVEMEKDSSVAHSPSLLMVENFLNSYVTDDNEVIVLTHVTSPFLKKETILDAVKYLDKGYDFVHSVFSVQDFAWYKGKPLNFDPHIVQKTQNLNKLVFSCGAFFIFTKKSFKEHQNRISVKSPELNHYYPLSKIESIEIDTEQDFELALLVYEGVKKCQK